MESPLPSRIASPLPSNDELVAFSEAVPWKTLEKHKRSFNEEVKRLAGLIPDDALPLEDLADAVGIPLSLKYPPSDGGNVILGQVDGRQYVLGSFVSKHLRGKKTLLQSIVAYNFNPSVNHHNLNETENPTVQLRALGAELELGLYHPDGSYPTEGEVQTFGDYYRHNAHRLGITPQVDREACQYQVEVHVAPGVGYYRTRKSLEGILYSLAAASKATGLHTAILSAYPLKSDFKLTDDPKVHTAVKVMTRANAPFASYQERLAAVKARYHMDTASNVVQAFRLQGLHIHLDIPGRSEALGLLTFYTMLRSATAIANAAVLKGGPFVNGTCDPDLLCTREYLRQATVTGRMIDLPLTPHLTVDGLEHYASLLHEGRANGTSRALLYNDELGEAISVMHNPIGRVRPDLGTGKRICTIESTGMPINISASRQAAVLTDFEYTQVLVEKYFREHGLNLEPLYENQDLLEIIGPLSTSHYSAQQDHSDRVGTDIEVETAAGTRYSLPEFYEKKRLYMHRALVYQEDILPRDIDEVYMSMGRMLNPPSGHVAETIEQYIVDPTCRSTGNWGQILRDAFVEEGGTPGDHNPEAVLRVANRIHAALLARYA